MKRATTIILFLALLMLPIIAVSCKSVKSDSPSDIVKKTMDLYIKGDYNKAAIYYVNLNDKPMSDDEIKTLSTLLDFASQQEKKKGGISTYNITDEKIDDDGLNAEVTFKKTFKDGSEDNGKTKLIKIDGKWFVTLKKR